MPIGKNALKRVTNNGYSNVVTSAPDMENSTVEPISEEETLKTVKKTTRPSAKTVKTTKTVEKKETISAVKKAEKKSSDKTKTSEAKKKKAESPASKLTAESEKVSEADKVIKIESAENVKNEKEYVNVGRPMPSYLL